MNACNLLSCSIISLVMLSCNISHKTRKVPSVTPLAIREPVSYEDFEKSIHNGGWQLSEIFFFTSPDKIGQIIWDANQTDESVPMFTRLGDYVYQYARPRLCDGSLGDVVAYKNGLGSFNKDSQTFNISGASLLGVFNYIKRMKIYSFSDTVMTVLSRAKDNPTETCLYKFHHLSHQEIDEWRYNLSHNLLKQSNQLSASQFKTLFGKYGWKIQEYYDVYANDSIGIEVIEDMADVPTRDFLLLEGNLLHHTDGSSIEFAYNGEKHILKLANHKFFNGWYHINQYTILSINDSEMRCLGPVLEKRWAEKAIAGLYIYKSMPKEEAKKRLHL